jgi:serine/threonine protein kinase/tetratricopeptide (TPR) repeat protein
MSIAASQGILCGRYTLLGKLGTGGQAEVWRARDVVQGGELALKILLPAVASDATAWAALEREHSIASRLDHPLILKVWAPVRDADTVALPMEFALGGDLRRLRGVSYLEIVPVLLEVAAALEHAHSRGVIHRDLKPGNVLFDGRGHVRLADFGIAGTVLGVGEPSAPSGRVAVSPFTASPEQLRGEPPAVSDDIYGLGALAYELLSGYPPFYPHFDFQRVLEEPVPELRPVYQAPPRLITLVTGMLAKRAANRPATMNEVIELLDAALNDTLDFELGGERSDSLDPDAETLANAASRADRAGHLTVVPRAPTRQGGLDAPLPLNRTVALDWPVSPDRTVALERSFAPNRTVALERPIGLERPAGAARVTHFEPSSRPSTVIGFDPPLSDYERSFVPPVRVRDLSSTPPWEVLPAKARATPPAPLAEVPPATPPEIPPSPPPEIAPVAPPEVPPVTPPEIPSAPPREIPLETARRAAPMAPREMPSAPLRQAPSAPPRQPPPHPEREIPLGAGAPPPSAAPPPAPPRRAWHEAPEHWSDIQIEVMPNLMRVEKMRRRRWPRVLVVMLAAAAAAAFFWLPQLAPRIEPPQGAVSLNQWLRDNLPHAPPPAAPPQVPSTSEPATTAPAPAPAAIETPAAPVAENQTDTGVQTRITAARQKFDKQLGALDARSAGVWGGVDYANAKAREAEAVAAADGGHPESAESQLAEAQQLLTRVEQRAPGALQAQLAAGETALRAGNSAAARQAFDLALRIDPRDSRASTGLKRAKRLDGVLPLLADGANAQASGDYARAVQDFSQVLAVDPDNAQARAGLTRAHAGLGADHYARAVGLGFAALGAGRLEDARGAFEDARRFNPHGREAQQGLDRVDLALRARSFAETRVRAQGLEAQERWGEALQVYDLALREDPSLGFAQRGRARALEHAELSNRLQALVDEPQRLASPSVHQEALRLIHQASLIDPSGPVLRSLAARLTILLPEFDKPVHLALVSDNQTQVEIAQIGSFGSFARRDVELKPGRYTVIGTRAGYRDVRRDVTVAPGGDIQTISVRCVEPI